MVELTTREIRGTSDGPHLLITAGVHGDEFEGVAAVHRLMRRIDATELCGRVTLVPVVNESAFDRRSRCGADGLDLARSCPGKPDGSVTQQVAAALA
jgi:predicted deacylase